MNQIAEQHHSMTQLSPQSMTASAATDSSKAIAEIQSAMTIAKRFPRDERSAIERIKNSFGRVTLAENSQYQYSKGGSSVSGPSIRSAEAIAQLWGNVEFGFREIARGVGHDGVGYSEVQAYAWDIETNTKRPATFVVRHWRDTRSGGYALKDEREIYELMANMAQRRVRACIISIIPGDVFDAAMAAATETLRSNVDISSPTGVKKMLDAFGSFGVTRQMVEERIQRSIESIQPGQMVQLKRIYASLRDGMGDVSDWFGPGSNSASGQAGRTEAKLPPLTDDEFKANFPEWQQAVIDGKTTPERIIGMVSSKYTLTEKQLSMINGMHVPGQQETTEQQQETEQQAPESTSNDDWLDGYENG